LLSLLGLPIPEGVEGMGVTPTRNRLIDNAPFVGYTRDYGHVFE
jgi:hypothetical protein